MPKGLEACPGVVGGTEWNGPAYDVREKAVVVGAVDWCSMLQRDAEPKYERGALYFGGHFQAIMDPPPSGWITSVDAASGRVRWKFHAPAPVIAAITPTAGGVTFAGDQLGNFYALRSSDGGVLFETSTAGAIAGGIVTYSVSQRQYVAITSGNISRAVWGATGLPYIIVYALGGASSPTEAASIADVNAARGQGAYDRICANCHGAGGSSAGASAPSLRGIHMRMTGEQLASQIRKPKTPPGKTAPSMPPLDAFVLSQQELLDVGRLRRYALRETERDEAAEIRPEVRYEAAHTTTALNRPNCRDSNVMMYRGC